MMKFTLLPLLALAFVSISTAGADDKTYKLRLDREVIKGAKTKETITGSSSQTQTVTAGGKVVQEQKEELSGKIVGVREILEVNEKKKATKFKFAVEKLTLKKGDEKEQELLNGGTEMVVSRNKKGEMSFTVDGEEADADTKKLLDVFFELPREKEPEFSEDEAFGTDKPRKVGDEWNVDIEKLLKSMPEDMPFTVDASGSSGTMKFNGVKTEDGVECCEASSQVKLKVKSIKGMPKEMSSSKAQMKITISGLLPTDPALPDLETTMAMDMEFGGNVTGPDGSEATVKVKSSNEKREQVRPVK